MNYIISHFNLYTPTDLNGNFHSYFHLYTPADLNGNFNGYLMLLTQIRSKFKSGLHEGANALRFCNYYIFNMIVKLLVLNF